MNPFEQVHREYYYKHQRMNQVGGWKEGHRYYIYDMITRRLDYFVPTLMDVRSWRWGRWARKEPIEWDGLIDFSEVI